MRMFKVLLDFIKYPAEMLVEFGGNVVSKLTGNASFPNLYVPLAQMTTAINAVAAAIIAADGGGKVQKLALKQAVNVLVDLLKQNADYVDRVAKGSELLIVSSGYHPTHQPSPAQRPDFRVKVGEEPGSMDLSHVTIKGARGYIWQYCLYSEINIVELNWVFAGASTKTHYTVHGLRSGTKYMFRCSGLKPDGMTVWCEPISKVAP